MLFNGPGTPSLINCTVAHNTKGVGVGDLATLLTMTNCIVVNNGGGGIRVVPLVKVPIRLHSYGKSRRRRERRGNPKSRAPPCPSPPP